MKIAIIGCGNMGSSLAKQLAKHEELQLYDRNLPKAKTLAEAVGAQAKDTPKTAIADAQIVLLAVKPQAIETVSHHLLSVLQPTQIVISVAANVPVSLLEKLFERRPILRIMPNIACAHGKGMIGMVETEHTTAAIKKTVEKALNSLGLLVWLPEEQIEAITALSSSGLAFAFVMIESMVDAGISMGLSKDLAMRISLQMLEGAITLLKETGKGTSDLKWQVASPAGTTIAGLAQLENDAVRAGIINAFLTTYSRAKESIPDRNH